jgi:hypothetical protein
MAIKAPNAFKRGVADDWTLERIARMSAQEIRQLRENAERLNEPSVTALCDQALAGARSRARVGRKGGPHTQARRLIARTKAFEACGVSLQDPKTSWGGVRKADGAVVMALWADAIQSADGGCRYLLWAPNVEGSRPWSDRAAGRERLEQCKQAMARGQAEGLLVYGERFAEHLPEEKAHAVHGVDPETRIVFEVAQLGEEFWAVWGGKAPAAALGST